MTCDTPQSRMTIRYLSNTDSQDVLRMNAAAGSAVFQLDLTEFERLMTISTLHLAVECSSDTITGYVLAFSKDQAYDGEEYLTFRSSIVEPFLYIDQIVIDECARGAGIGRMLYEELASRARNIGATILCCEVNVSPPNPNSLAFHRYLGFTQIGDLKTLDGRIVTLLTKEI